MKSSRREAAGPAAAGSEVTVVVIDDDPASREWVGGIAESVGYKVAAFGTAVEFLEQSRSGQRGCLLVDVRLPQISGLDLLGLLRERGIELPVIIMTAFGEVDVAVRALKGGAFDFLEKPCGSQTLIDRINRAVEADGRDAAEAAARQRAREALASLSDGERRVLDGIMAGLANKVVAAELEISEKTVEARRRRLMEKMGAGSLAELVQLTLRARAEPGPMPFR